MTSGGRRRKRRRRRRKPAASGQSVGRRAGKRIAAPAIGRVGSAIMSAAIETRLRARGAAPAIGRAGNGIAAAVIGTGVRGRGAAAATCTGRVGNGIAAAAIGIGARASAAAVRTDIGRVGSGIAPVGTEARAAAICIGIVAIGTTGAAGEVVVAKLTLVHGSGSTSREIHENVVSVLQMTLGKKCCRHLDDFLPRVLSESF